jgi:8-oxo-dGTP pyrophosphatase MutT (NUDIX family)
MNPSTLDMFVGGLPLAGESLESAARSEVREELGLAAASLDFMLQVRSRPFEPASPFVIDPTSAPITLRRDRAAASFT